MFAMKYLVLPLLFVALVSSFPSNGDKRLIKTGEDIPPTWLSQEEIHSLIAKNVNFIDVTGRNYPSTADKRQITELPTAIRFQQIVRAALPAINVPRLANFVTTFSTQFHNRYYTTATGVAAAEWLLSQVADTIAASGYPGNATVSTYTHSWAQKSIIARVEGSDPTLRHEVLIFGGHLDSVNSLSPVAGLSPGADDNASGSATLLEGLRVFLASRVIPLRSVEFHWYAAEEVGLRGSGDIAEAYFNQRIPVIGMVNYDVVGYNAAPHQISFLSDYTDLEFSNFLKLVVDEYCGVGWVDYRCGYGCSDHASWTDQNFRSASPNENPLSPYMHGTRDTIDTVNFEVVAEFVKLTVAAAIEIAEPSNL